MHFSWLIPTFFTSRVPLIRLSKLCPGVTYSLDSSTSRTPCPVFRNRTPRILTDCDMRGTSKCNKVRNIFISSLIHGRQRLYFRGFPGHELQKWRARRPSFHRIKEAVLAMKSPDWRTHLMGNFLARVTAQSKMLLFAFGKNT
jgi:hypothetical protein